MQLVLLNILNYSQSLLQIGLVLQLLQLLIFYASDFSDVDQRCIVVNKNLGGEKNTGAYMS